MVKKYIIFANVLFVGSTLSAAITWPLLLSAQPRHMMLIFQYADHCGRVVPKVAAPCVKAYAHAREKAYEDLLINVSEQSHARIQMMPDPESPYASIDCNAGHQDAGKMEWALWMKLMRMVLELDLLAEKFEHKPGTLNIQIFEAMRPIALQEKIFAFKMAEIKKVYPDWTDEQVEAEAERWGSWAKNNIPAHSTGRAVDIRLWNTEIKSFVDMGPFGVAHGNEQASTYSTDITSQQMQNRMLMLKAASAAGLVNYPYEWWHFSTGDAYARYWVSRTA